MAAEVATADHRVAEGELHFLEALRIALRIAPLEAEGVVAAATAFQLADYLDDRYHRIRGLVPVAAEVFALRALGLGIAGDDERFRLRDFFLAIPDLAIGTEDLDGVLYQAFRRPRARDAQVYSELAAVAQTMPDPVDRYWIMVYTLVAEAPAAVANWRVIPFTGVMQHAFHIVDTDMELAVVDALAFPAALPRPL
jgi:hypothetical protein